jgi:hypothetical protein
VDERADAVDGVEKGHSLDAAAVICDRRDELGRRMDWNGMNRVDERYK